MSENKVYVVTNQNRAGEVVGVFSNERDAIAYCDNIDPAELAYCVDECELDALEIGETNEITN